VRILITGAGGFIGRHLVERLAGEHEIYALVRRRPKQPFAGVTYLQHDLSQTLDPRRLPSRIDAIIHQAAVIDTDNLGPDLARAVNIGGTLAMLGYAAASGVQTFLYASTGGVYGCRDRPFVESDPYNPMDLYSDTKVQAERAVLASIWSFRRVVLRYFFPYGIGTPNPIPRFVECALTGQLIDILPGGRPRLNPLHISDAVEATVRALQLGQNTIINIAGIETVTFAEIAWMAAAYGGRRPRFFTIAEAESIPYYRADLVADITQMKNLLNFTPSIKLSEGIAELVRNISGV
jgi:nucleoside-diphosphate-sugar epimerase